jgi:hypothetical protein
VPELAKGRYRIRRMAAIDPTDPNASTPTEATLRESGFCKSQVMKKGRVLSAISLPYYCPRMLCRAKL